MITRTASLRIRWLRHHRARLVALAVTPVLVLGLLWLLVTQVLMVPAVPDEQTPPADVARFLMHNKGLPRLSTARFETWLDVFVPRLAKDPAFRERFLVEYRTASSEDQSAFREHLFDAFKPLVMRDVDAYFALPEFEQQTYLDERIVEYNRVGRSWGDATISKGMLGGGALSPTEAMNFLFRKTTAQERETALAYAQALAARIEVILGDPDLTADFEARIAAALK